MEDIKEDRSAHYFVTKQEDVQEVKVDVIVNTIKVYVMNKPVYFIYDTNFVDGVMIFGVKGFEEDHKELQDVLGGDIEKLGCSLSWQYKDKMGVTHKRGEENG